MKYGLERLQELLDEAKALQESYDRIIEDNDRFLNQYKEKRSDPARPDRMPSYSEKKFLEKVGDFWRRVKTLKVWERNSVRKN